MKMRLIKKMGNETIQSDVDIGLERSPSGGVAITVNKNQLFYISNDLRIHVPSDDIKKEFIEDLILNWKLYASNAA